MKQNHYSGIEVIAFDADDTLWENEPFFRQAEEQFLTTLSGVADRQLAQNTLNRIEIANLDDYGYGVKSFVLSMVESAISLIRVQQGSEGGKQDSLPADTLNQILNIGREMLHKPVRLLDGVESVLENLSGRNYRLIVATKGDLLDQQRKLEKSGLASYFHHIEVMSNKDSASYGKLLMHLDIAPDRFLMVGNSVRSDILPVIEAGGRAVHIPFHTTWAHEEVENYDRNSFTVLRNIGELLSLLPD
jgi:putative hydrolase of the HAD superfamily